MTMIVGPASDALILALTPVAELTSKELKQKQNLIDSVRRILKALDELQLPPKHKEILLGGVATFREFFEKQTGKPKGPIPPAGFVDKMKEMVVPGKIAAGCAPDISAKDKEDGEKLRAAIFEAALSKSTSTTVKKYIEELQALGQSPETKPPGARSSV